MAEDGRSARRISLEAELSSNYVNNLLRGISLPSAASLRKICTALGLSDARAAELRQAAGIDPPAGSAPAEIEARNAAWRPLLYILVNHISLPRFEFLELIESRRVPAPARALLSAAANAPHALDFACVVRDVTLPDWIRARLDSAFGGAPLAALHSLAHHEKSYNDLARGLGDRTDAPRYRWPELSVCTWLLDAYNAPRRPLGDLTHAILTDAHDFNFGVAYFPPLYWHACRAWPFEKVRLPYGRIGPDAQRRLYDAVRAGLSLDEMAQSLTGSGPLGEQLARIKPLRPTPSAVMRGLHKQAELPESTLPTGAVYDHLDRSEFLARFPLLTIALDEFKQRGRALDHPYWNAWRHFFQQSFLPRFRKHGWSEADPPLCPDRYQHVRFGTRAFRDAECDDPDTLDSFTERHTVDQIAASLAGSIGAGEWPRILAVAELVMSDSEQAGYALRSSDNWLSVIRALDAQRRSELKRLLADRAPKIVAGPASIQMHGVRVPVHPDRRADWPTPHFDLFPDQVIEIFDYPGVEPNSCMAELRIPDRFAPHTLGLSVSPAWLRAALEHCRDLDRRALSAARATAGIIAARAVAGQTTQPDARPANPSPAAPNPASSPAGQPSEHRGGQQRRDQQSRDRKEAVFEPASARPTAGQTTQPDARPANPTSASSPAGQPSEQRGDQQRRDRKEAGIDPAPARPIAGQPPATDPSPANPTSASSPAGESESPPGPPPPGPADTPSDPAPQPGPPRRRRRGPAERQ